MNCDMNNIKQQKEREESIKLAKTLFLIFIVFVACWGPYIILIVSIVMLYFYIYLYSICQSGIVLDQVPIQSLAQVPRRHLVKWLKGTWSSDFFVHIWNLYILTYIFKQVNGQRALHYGGTHAGAHIPLTCHRRHLASKRAYWRVTSSNQSQLQARQSQRIARPGLGQA